MCRSRPLDSSYWIGSFSIHSLIPYIGIMAANSMEEARGAETNYLVSFVSKYDAYRIDVPPFAIPGNLNRTGLSEVINHLRAVRTYFLPFLL